MKQNKQIKMAGFNRPRFPGYGNEYYRNGYENNNFTRHMNPSMRNMGCGPTSPAFQRYPTPNMGMGPFSNRPPFVGNHNEMAGPPHSPPFRGPMITDPRMGPPRMQMRPQFHNSGSHPHMPHPQPFNRFFAPWNNQPSLFYAGPRRPMQHPGPRGKFSNQQNRNQQFQKPQEKQQGDGTTPTKKKKKKKKATNPTDEKMLKPWMTEEIYDQVKKKNKMFLTAKNSNSDELWQEFKIQRNKVSSLIKEAKIKSGIVVRKPKAEDLDPTPRPHSCDTCDRAFAEESELEQHTKEHVKCDIDGCPFEAHPKVVDLHKKVQHDTGLASFIWKLTDNSEIAKWVNERKSNYPTAENIKKRKAELEERIARGEVIETEEFGQFKNKRGCIDESRGGGQRGRRKKPRWYREREQRRKAKQHAESNQLENEKDASISSSGLKYVPIPSSDSDDDFPSKLPKFCGMTAQMSPLLNPVASSPSVPCINDTILHNNTKPNIEKCTEKFDEMPSAADQLVETDRTAILECSQELSTTGLTNGKDANSDDDDAPEEIPISKVDNSELVSHPGVANHDDQPLSESMQTRGPKPKTMDNTHGRNRPQQPQRSQNYTPMKKSTLLQKLLAKEIRHERNVILQCIRYIVKNNFFEMDTS